MNHPTIWTHFPSVWFVLVVSVTTSNQPTIKSVLWVSDLFDHIAWQLVVV